MKPQRPPYRVPLGMPRGRENWRVSTVLSVLAHLVVIALLVMRFGSAEPVTPIEQGAGGAGPAGGGGGGRFGSGSPREELHFVQVAPPAPAQKPTPVQQAVIPPPPKPVVPPPEPSPEPEPAKAEAPPLPAGTGGGTGSDSTGGSGPGTGGGVGTGVGTGRGSATGPGTGGGQQASYAPTPIEMFIPPLPVPESVRGTRVIAEFDVDEHGRVLSLHFTETRDRGYNRRLNEVLKGFRFRPGTTPDGTPIRMKAQVTIDLP